jgi:hypothetical protein
MMSKLFVLAATLTVSAAVGCGGADQGQTGDEQDVTSRNQAIAASVEADVRDHAKNRTVTKLEDAIKQLTSARAEQDALENAIFSARPDGTTSPYYGYVTVSGKKYVWADFETDEGEGPVQQGTTQVFDAKAGRVLSRNWTGSHQY